MTDSIECNKRNTNCITPEACGRIYWTMV